MAQVQSLLQRAALDMAAHPWHLLWMGLVIGIVVWIAARKSTPCKKKT